MTEPDCEPISEAFAAQGWNKPVAQYQRYMRESIAGTRAVLVAERDGEFAGYVNVLWASDYAPFRAEQIPEIADFNVLERFQRQGIGSALLDAAGSGGARLMAPCVVLEGAPAYYRRKGFDRAVDHGLLPPSDRIADDDFLAMELDPAEDWMSGRVVYHDVWWEHGAVGYRSRTH